MITAVLLVGCAQARGAEVPPTGAGEVWVVEIGYPEGDWATCFEDDAVARSVTTLDLPASRATATLTADADEHDVRRILDCLDGSRSGGDVSVTARPLGRDAPR